MKVDQRYLEQAGSSRLNKAQETQATEPGQKQNKPSRSSQASDRVHVSDLSGRVLEMASTDQPGRAERVARLAADYQSGRYKVDPAEVARSMVAEAINNVA